MRVEHDFRFDDVDALRRLAARADASLLERAANRKRLRALCTVRIAGMWEQSRIADSIVMGRARARHRNCVLYCHRWASLPVICARARPRGPPAHLLQRHLHASLNPLSRFFVGAVRRRAAALGPWEAARCAGARVPAPHDRVSPHDDGRCRALPSLAASALPTGAADGARGPRGSTRSCGRTRTTTLRVRAHLAAADGHGRGGADARPSFFLCRSLAVLSQRHRALLSLLSAGVDDDAPTVPTAAASV